MSLLIERVCLSLLKATCCRLFFAEASCLFQVSEIKFQLIITFCDQLFPRCTSFGIGVKVNLPCVRYKLQQRVWWWSHKTIGRFKVFPPITATFLCIFCRQGDHSR